MGTKKRDEAESKYPAILSVIGCVVFVALVYYRKVNIDNFEKLTDVSINISGILLGFLITLHGILISIRGSKVMRFLQQAGSLTNLNSYLKAAIVSSALVLVFCLIVLIFDFQRLFAAPNTKEILFLVWITLVLYMTTTAYRFISLFISIISEDVE